MDVTSTASSTIGTTVGAAPSPPLPVSTGRVAASSQSSGPVTSTAAVAATPSSVTVLPVLGSPKAQNASQQTQQQSGIAPAIAKLFGTGGGAPTPISLNVSYRVDGDFIVTIFTDPKSGQEVAQLPPEILIGLAQFFDQQDGVTLDKSA